MLFTGYKKICIVARRKAQLEETAKMMQKHIGSSGRIVISANDIGTEQGVQACVKDAVAAFGRKFK